MSAPPSALQRLRAASVLCVGQATLDHVFSVDGPIGDGHKHAAAGYHRVGGGVAANAAVAVARLGGSATILGCVGDDADGDAVLAGLRAEHVDTQYVLRVAGAGTPVSAVIVGAGGGRTVVNHTPRDLFAQRAPTIHPGGFDAVLADGRWPSGTEMALRLARARGVPGVVDVDRCIGVEDEQRTVFDLATHLVFGADALSELTGTDDPGDGLRRVSTLTRAHVSVTCGAGGVRWLEDGALQQVPAFEVDAVDTTAAGDVFHGALALALGEGAEIPAAFTFAAAAAALKCTRAGAREGIPNREDVENLLVGRTPAGRS